MHIQATVADPGEGPRGPGPPYLSTKMRPEGPEKKPFGDRPGPHSLLSEGLKPPLSYTRQLTTIVKDIFSFVNLTVNIVVYFIFSNFSVSDQY